MYQCSVHDVFFFDQDAIMCRADTFETRTRGSYLRMHIIRQLLLQNTDIASFVGYQFFDRNTPVELTDHECLFGDQFSSRIFPKFTSGPLNRLLTGVRKSSRPCAAP